VRVGYCNNYPHLVRIVLLLLLRTELYYSILSEEVVIIFVCKYLHGSELIVICLSIGCQLLWEKKEEELFCTNSFNRLY
jgi:hypothetical protein